MAMRRIDLAKTGTKLDDALLGELDPARLPAHVAIIMDGNGRWAKQRHLPRIAGHRAGADAVRRSVETAARLGLQCLTLYAFSTENWKRPRLEVRALMDLLMEFLRKELQTLRDNNIRFRLIGRSDGLHISVLEQIRRAELATMQNTGLQLNIAINYGGRTELVDACRLIAEEVAAGRLRPDEINEQVIESKLYTRSLPDPDLLIRTSGETRISNFLLWQIAYSEIFITPTLWPDFDERAFLTALIEYQKRDRRYGGVTETKPALTLEWDAARQAASAGD
ncbi:MAG: isoprenyl transferase [Blastocatellia bacterium]